MLELHFEPGGAMVGDVKPHTLPCLGTTRGRLARVLLSVLFILPAASMVAAPKLASVFGNDMVIQRDAPIPVWGRADPAETISVMLKGRNGSAVADADGRWMVELAPLPADSVSADLVVTGAVEEEKITLTNVVVGDVWLASGQSNMAWTVSRSDNAETEIAAARYPLIRELAVARTTAATPQEEVEATWSACSPESVGRYSAAAYYFARELHRTLGIPVGIINASWGGTPVEAWTRREALTAEPRLMDVFVRWEGFLGAYPESRAEYERAVADWEQRKSSAEALGTEFKEQRPREPRGPLHQHRPANLYNGMIHPLLPVGIKGVIWYQGEANAWKPEEYAVSFPLMIRDWRSRWGKADLPFFFVQLADFAPGGVTKGGTWPWLREAQAAALKLHGTGMAVTIDIGNPNNIHPTNKQDVGRRLARLALHRVHGMDVEDSGPVLKSMRVRRNTAELSFDHIAGGLAAFGAGVDGLVIAGEDRVFYPASAHIEGNKVIASSLRVAKPVAVRYAWDNSPDATLTNSEGLPAAPFRTDDWPAQY